MTAPQFAAVLIPLALLGAWWAMAVYARKAAKPEAAGENPKLRITVTPLRVALTLGFIMLAGAVARHFRDGFTPPALAAVFNETLPGLIFAGLIYLILRFAWRRKG